MDNVTPVIAWLAPIVSTLIITWLTAVINEKMDESRRDVEREAEERKVWHDRVETRITQVEDKIDSINNATQTTMRTTLLHYCEKYLTRGWVTPEERASLFDMHKKYSKLNANGYIDSYIARVGQLPDKEI